MKRESWHERQVKLTQSHRVRRLLVDDRGVLAPSSGRLGANLYGVVRRRLQALERRREVVSLNDGGVGRILEPRITPHCKSSQRHEERERESVNLAR